MSLPGVPADPPSKAVTTRSRVAPIVFLMLAVVLAAGLLGTGPLSWTTVQQGDLTVHYQRFARQGAPWTLSVESPRNTPDAVVLRLDHTLLEAVKVEAITPSPDQVKAEDGMLVYTFPAATDGRSTVDFHLRGDALWRQRGVVSLPDGSSVTIDQFVYP